MHRNSGPACTRLRGTTCLLPVLSLVLVSFTGSSAEMWWSSESYDPASLPFGRRAGDAYFCFLAGRFPVRNLMSSRYSASDSGLLLLGSSSDVHPELDAKRLQCTGSVSDHFACLLSSWLGSDVIVCIGRPMGCA
ncbi:hypothetical protein BD311DRAFT_322630 [Dichomitus squalens]|uniref:Secreted protein n=1 Tax=Dichomitus squalens TaxID=114155 RepID=A0A4Q9MQN2_9APHY|nr:hypothetical protein BD311DRAFT_322630 [Dichomitus squalens]